MRTIIQTEFTQNVDQLTEKFYFIYPRLITFNHNSLSYVSIYINH